MSKDETTITFRKDWLKGARSVARRINIGWWLDRLTPILIIVTLLSATVIICLRTFWTEQSGNPSWLWSGAGFMILLAAIAAFIIAKKRFIGEKEGLVRIEDQLRLNNALSSADRGVGHWPEFEKSKLQGSGLNWNWPILLVPFLFTIIIISGAIWMPILEVNAAAKLPPSEPSAWAQMEDWIDSLEEEELIEESGIEEVREKIEELRAQPEDEWFSHSSMEATDTLRDSLGRDIRNIAAEMGTLERDLNALQNHASQLSEASKEMLLKEYDEAMKNMALNSLGLNKELLKQLQGIDPKQLSQMQMGQMSKEQMDQLRKQMGKSCDKLGSMDGLPKLGENEDFDQWLAGMCNKPGTMPGRGGINRGRGDAPLFFGDESDLKTNNIETIKNGDLTNATPGDLLAVGETTHEIEEVNTGPQKGGEVSSKGKGGEAVWRESLMPNEKALLKRYFK